MTTKKVVVNVPSLPKDEPIEVLYLGVFDNGGTHDLTDDQVAQYEAASQREFPTSGYLFAGAPHGDVQNKAYAANEEEGIKTTRTTDLVATQLDAVIANPAIDTIEGSDATTDEEGEK